MPWACCLAALDRKIQLELASQVEKKSKEENKKASINCYFCNKDYKLDLKDLEEIYDKAIQINTKEK